MLAKIKLKLYILFSVCISVVLVACAKSDEEKISELARVQSSVAVAQENANLIARTAELEQVLAAKHSLYGALEGHYSGQYQTDGAPPVQIDLNIHKNIPPSSGLGGRRVLEEIAQELQSLSLNIEVVEVFAPAAMGNVVGCVFSQVRPSFENGRLRLLSETCSKSYDIYLLGATPNSRGEIGAVNSNDVADNRVAFATAARDIGQSLLRRANLSVDSLGSITHSLPTGRYQSMALRRVTN